MPEAPSHLTLTAQSTGTSMVAQWTNEDNYGQVKVEYNKGAGWVIAWQGVTRESYTLRSVTVNTTYTVRVAGGIGLDWSDYSHTDTATCFSDTLSETFSASDNLAENLITGDILHDSFSVSDTFKEVGTYVEAFTETFSMSDHLADAQTLRTDYAYYLVSPDGNSYQLGKGYLGDAGSNITSTFQTKTTDFEDQHPEDANQFKEVFGARLNYIDTDSDITVSVSYSIDGGTTWNTVTKIMGGSTNVAKTEDFHFRATANEFAFKVEHASSDAEFNWTGLKIFYLPAGDFFSI